MYEDETDSHVQRCLRVATKRFVQAENDRLFPFGGAAKIVIIATFDSLYDHVRGSRYPEQRFAN